MRLRAGDVNLRSPCRTGCCLVSTGQWHLRGAFVMWTVLAGVAGLALISCSGPVANLVISAPPNAVAGTPFSVTVAAKVNGSPDTVFNSPIHFTSSDSAAILPRDYQFVSSDRGSHTFTNGVTLLTPGSQTVTATDGETSFLTATANVTVTIADSAIGLK